MLGQIAYHNRRFYLLNVKKATMPCLEDLGSQCLTESENFH